VLRFSTANIDIKSNNTSFNLFITKKRIVLPKIMTKNAIIIGGGVAGLAVAIRLAARGYQVDLFEKNDGPGGKMREKIMNGFRFDLGPSLFTAPHLVEELLTLSGHRQSIDFDYYRLPVLCHYFFANGKQFFAPSDSEEFALAMEQSIGEPAENVKRFLQYARNIHHIAGGVFLEESLHKASTYFKRRTLTSLAQIYKIDPFRTMHKANTRKFFTQEAVQLFNRYATYNGSNPFKTPATLNLISTLEMDGGAYLPKKGIHQIADSLHRAGAAMGVNYHFNRTVKQIVQEKGKVKGVVMDTGEQIGADLVVSNMDAFYSYGQLLNDRPKAEKIDRLERSGSALIFYWGISQTFPALDVHNIFFSGDYEEEFKRMFDMSEVYDDPTIYVHISSKLLKEDAPEGKENWFVMINAPSDPSYFTEENVSAIRSNVIQKLNRMLQVSLEEMIECEDILTPGLIQDRTFSYKGALYGTSSNRMLSAFFRPSNKHSGIKDLYFCGGSVHPGGGIPLCLMSARMVDRLIK
jgi:phytoene desaturase